MGSKRRAGKDDGLLADLHDQASWSSYTQDIPRLGNPKREAIRLARYRRAFLRWPGWIVAYVAMFSLVAIAFLIYLLIDLLL